jgi:hypothetical protein
MRPAACSLFLVALASLLRAQATPAPPAGLQPDWDIRVILQEMSAHAVRLAPVLAEIDTKAWVDKGASDTYTSQLESSKAQAQAISDGAQALMKNPEKLSACLELYFRITGLEDMLRSLEDGIRKYQDPALAQKLAGLSAENGANRNRFQSYIVNLSSQQEQECAVMDREAQRCRSIVATEPPAAARTSGPAAGRKK